MSTSIVQTSDRTVTPFSKGQSLGQQEDSGTAGGWLPTLRAWIERSQQRKALRELSRLNDGRLDDVGISQADAQREGGKRFWQV